MSQNQRWEPNMPTSTPDEVHIAVDLSSEELSKNWPARR